jgi:hypothetical protein
LIGTYAALLPANSQGSLNNAVGVGSFMEIDVNNVISLDGDAISGAIGQSRFEINQGLTADIADLYVASGAINGGATDGNFEGDFDTPGYTISTFTLRDGLQFANGSFRVENRKDYYQRYLGAEFLFQKRFSNRWSLGANVTYNDWTEHFTVGGEGDNDPNRALYANGFNNIGVNGGPIASRSLGSGSKGDVYINSKWQTSFRGSYSIPVVDVDLGANVLFRQGYISPFTDTVRTAVPGDASANKSMLAFGLDDFRMHNVFNLDLHVGKNLNFTDSMGLELGVDLFNAFNSDTILQHRRRIDSTTFLDPAEVIGPRLLRLSARAKF